MPKLFSLTIIASLLTACGSWVQVTSAGQNVSVASPSEVSNCTRIGSSTSNALDKIGFIDRSGNKLQEELINLARNEAGDMGGNRIVIESPISEGTQSFGIYRCGL
ncbi:MAG: DUF4156 domain-containing protein [Pseudohongiellaceae bacterium]|nr:DUF4156 domain-containing protein [Pseudohongiellaceae bacterium]